MARMITIGGGIVHLFKTALTVRRRKAVFVMMGLTVYGLGGMSHVYIKLRDLVETDVHLSAWYYTM